MKKLFRVTQIDKSTAEKIEMLEKSGVKISILDKNKKHKEGYTLGSMKDTYPEIQMLKAYN